MSNTPYVLSFDGNRESNGQEGVIKFHINSSSTSAKIAGFIIDKPRLIFEKDDDTLHPFYRHLPQLDLSLVKRNEVPPKPEMLEHVDDEVYSNFMNKLVTSETKLRAFTYFIIVILSTGLSIPLLLDKYYISIPLTLVTVFIAMVCGLAPIRPEQVTERFQDQFQTYGIKVDFVQYKQPGTRHPRLSKYVIFSNTMPIH